MTRKEKIYEFLRKMKHQQGYEAVYTADEIANATGTARANVSSDLNRLFEEERVEKIQGKPVRYRACTTILTPMPTCTDQAKHLEIKNADNVFSAFIGFDGSMRMEVEKAKASVLYPPYGLPMLIEGPTGVGKTMFAQLMYQYAKKVGRLSEKAQFVSFNCADYAANPQLIISQLFGHAKGSFTGAIDEKIGLVEQADQGVLFLDEVHRLADTAQEMLFFLIDFGQYRRLGEAEITRSARPMIILATTEDCHSVLLNTFKRRIPVTVEFPSLARRSAFERLKLIELFFAAESHTLQIAIQVDSLAIKALLAYDCPGNVGQLQSDIRLTCAKAYVLYLMGKQDRLSITILELPPYVKEGIVHIRSTYSDINLISSSLSFEIETPIQSTKEKVDICGLLEQYPDLWNDASGKNKCVVAVICNGEGAAKAMAKVANSILGKESVKWLDFTRSLGMEELSDCIAQLLGEFDAEGIVLLVDTEALLPLEEIVSIKTKAPTRIVCNVSTAMVIEAALLAEEHKASTEQIFTRLQNLESSFNVLYERQTKKSIVSGTKKAIVTACFSGCGAALKLKRIIEERFVIQSELEILTIDIASITGLKNRIEEIAAVYDIICVVGVDVGLEMSVPFISADSFILGQGMMQLADMLRHYNVAQRQSLEKEYNASNNENLLMSGKELSRYLFYLDGTKLAPFVVEALERIERRTEKLKRGKRTMLFIHLCCMTERLMFDKADQAAVDEPQIDAALQADLTPLADAYHIRIPWEEYDMIERILDLVYDN